MKILFITARYYPEGAGSGKSVRNLARYLASIGHDIIVACLHEGQNKRIEMREGVKIYYLPIRNIYGLNPHQKPAIAKAIWHGIDAWNPMAMHDIAHVLDQEKPDVVNTNVIAGCSAGIFQAIKCRNIPLVHTLRDYYLICAQSGMFKRGKACETLCRACNILAQPRKFLARYVDLFLANSEFVLDRHRQYGVIAGDGSARVLLNMNESGAIAAPRGKLETVRFGYIGRVAPVKGIESIFEAVSEISVKGWSLKIAGDGEANYFQSITSMAAASPYADAIEMMGRVDADAFYQNIDVLICPSVYAEPLPRVIYEAYAHGVPVITSDAGGSPEIVSHGKTGFVYPAGDAKALAGFMQQFIDDAVNDQPFYPLMSRCAADMAMNFTPAVIGENYLSAIEDLLRQRAPRSDGGQHG